MPINNTANNNENLWYLICKNRIWHTYDMHMFVVIIMLLFNTQFSHAYDTKFVGVDIIRSFR